VGFSSGRRSFSKESRNEDLSQEGAAGVASISCAGANNPSAPPFINRARASAVKE